MSFDKLKKNSGAAALQKLSQEVANLNNKANGSGSREDDERFWRPTLDKVGNGSAVIRFLPPAEGEDLPWVKLFTHSFQGPGGSWYIENSLTTLEQKDPVSEYNTQLWNSGIDANKEVARKQKRKLNFISNILVVKDPGNPENEGKVFLFKYGKKIFDKINDIMHPDNTGISNEDPDFKRPANPFDLWEGAHFKLRVRKVDGYPNYDKSEFGVQCQAVEGADEALKALWEKQHKLSDFLDAKNFKSYDELKSKLDRVLGLNGQTAATPKTKNISEVKGAVATATSTPATVQKDEDDELESLSGEESSDDLSFLQSLVKED